jgi:glycosyltransferase involved in cell wall biosynthesis
MSDPRVSVICIFYNERRFLGEALESVLGQSYRDFELIVADDGSSDESVAIARDYARRFPDRVRYVDHPGHANHGMSATRNLGLAAARGEFVAFIDADDVWLPEKLAEQVAILDANPDAGIVCGAVKYWNGWDGGKDVLTPTGHVQDAISRPPETSLALYPLGKAGAPCPSDILVRRSLIEKVGGFEEHFAGHRQMYEDSGFLEKAYLEAPVYFSSRNWLLYRRHDDSCMSKVVEAGQYEAVRRYFLDWFEGYLTGRSAPGKDELLQRIAECRRRLDRWPSAALRQSIKRKLRPLLRLAR